ncbi:MAG: sugar transferase [bacterium]|nr:sugar transferase [bacterium]
MNKLSLVVKRVMDITIVLVAMVLLLPFWLLIIVSVYIAFGSPVIYKSVRVGKNRKPFQSYKFRTMTNERDAAGELLPDKDRLRPVGRFIRRTSLDELPQLINVLEGHMSVIGPRALPEGHYQVMPEKYSKRADVKPGLTGWNQVNYQGQERSWDQKYSLDLEYLERQSILFDVKILFLTVGVLFRRFFSNKTGESLNSKE